MKRTPIRSLPDEPEICFHLWAASRSDGKVEIRLTLNQFKGRWFLSLREWFKTKTKGQFLPTRRGTTLRPEEVQGFMAAMVDAEARLRASGEGIGISEPGKT